MDSFPMELQPNLQELKAYTDRKMELAAILRHLYQNLRQEHLTDAAEQAGALSRKLAEDHFTLATLGQFKRGKSSLMNAILGCQLLPTGILPLTSAITVIKYGPTEKLLLTQNDSHWPKELPIKDLIYYVTEKENPSNIKQVSRATVELPLPFLRRGVEFVDTPGVGSAITANSDVTYTFLPQCDAAIFVTGSDNPLTSTELDLLHQAAAYTGKIFFVVNKMDLVPETERPSILNFISKILRQECPAQEIQLFPLSAAVGLAAKSRTDETAYKKSGLKALEDALAAFLAHEQGQVFLSRIIYQGIQLMQQTNQFSEKLISLAQSMSDNPKIAACLSVLSTPAADNKESSLRYTFPKPALIEDLHRRGCPACQYIAKITFDFLAWYQYQLSTQDEIQDHLAQLGGLCSFHTWKLHELSSAYGFSLGYNHTAETMVKKLKQASLHPDSQNVPLTFSQDTTHCFLCQALKAQEALYLQTLCQALQTADLKRFYTRSDGLCLRHLDQLLKIVTTPATKTFLLDHSAKQLEIFVEDMKTFALKHETIHRDLQTENERQAWTYAAIHLAGEKNIWLS